MITDYSNERLYEIRSFASISGLTESFERTFQKLQHYSLNGCDVNLYSDFAPLSLYFEVTRDGQFVLVLFG